MTYPEPDIMPRNLAYLQSRMSAASLDAVTGAVADRFTLEAEPRGDGGFNLLCAGDERKIALHSRRDPVGEAERLAEEIIGNQTFDGCVVGGFAGMRHLEALAARLRPGAAMIVIDLNPALFRSAMPYCPLDRLDRFGLRWNFIVSAEVETAKREFRALLKKMDSFQLAAVIHPAMMRLTPEPYQRLLSEIASEVKLETMDRATRGASAEAWLANAVDALPYLIANPPLEILRGRFAGNTAIIAAAGPSLADSIPLIRHMAPECLLFAVGTALKPLLAAGITPDFIVALDSDPATLRQIPPGGTGNTWLIAAPSIPPEMAKSFPGHILTYSFSGMKGFNRWLAAGGCPLPVMNVGGTVSLTAIDAALLTGCRLIVLCGLDLAMGSDGATHAANSMYDGCRAEAAQLVAVRGNYAPQVYTTPQFADYIKQMNAYLLDMSASGDVVFCNVSSGGAYLEHTRLCHPAEYGKGLPLTNQIDKSFLINGFRNNQPCTSHHWDDFLKKTAENLRQLSRGAAEAANICADLLRHGGMPPRDKLLRLDFLDGQMKKNPASDLIELALEGVLQSRRARNRPDKSRDEHLADGRELYGVMAEAARLYENKIDNIRKLL